MNSCNRNPITGIRFGYISADSLDPEVVESLRRCGDDEHWSEFLGDIRDQLFAVIEDHLRSDRANELVDRWVEDFSDHAGDWWHDDEPVHVGTMDGVEYQTSWLGGALHVWVFDSPIVKTYQECSPCVPGAGNLDCPDLDGVPTYDVPDGWRRKDEN